MTDSVLTRMDNIDSAAVPFFTGRVVRRSLLQDYASYKEDELKQGVINLVSQGEGDYKQGKGMVAREGTQTVLMICYLKVNETDSPADVEKAEGTLMEEIKSFCRAGVPGMTLYLDNLNQSRQLSFPYGWVVATLRAGPSQSGIN